MADTAHSSRQGRPVSITELHQETTTYERSLEAWLADHGGQPFDPLRFMTEFLERVMAEGIPLFRMSMNLRDNHPQIAARGFTWVRGEEVQIVAFDFADRGSEAYMDSPIKLIHDGVAGIRRNLESDPAKFDFPVLHDLKEAGATDYVGMAMPFADGSRHYISWATDRPGGFTKEHLSRLDALVPFFNLRVELEHARLTTRQLMNTYLGEQAASRVLAGAIRRGEGEGINAIVLFCDLRGFTRLVELNEPGEVVDALSHYYEAVAEPVAAFGGDIVKMMGDGILAIFPLDPDAPQKRVDRTACGAVAAVKRAIANLKSIRSDELPGSIEELRAGFALHVGEVTFGNIGSLDRLDFTVIGPAVNEAVRAELLTKKLELPLVTTDAFAGLDCTVTLRSLGFHVLRGVPRPVEIFTLDEIPAAGAPKA